jgi:hypothetical protein
MKRVAILCLAAVALSLSVGAALGRKKKPVGADYKSYTPMSASLFKSESHQKRLVMIYANGVGLEAYKAKAGPMPEGTVIVKENFEDAGGKPGKLLELSVMQKLAKGASPATGDWYFATLNSAGKLDKENPKECAECHSFSPTDYIYGGQLK